ncbi:4Fe-4S binding domain [Firmicutes bacterium CAG:240]|nr:4Fe-4S binding domain [Firmicutes bacterium CAG:240]
MIRRVIQIDEEKCNGCGKCVHACHEGAIGLVDGKARLMRDDYCDGLGDCLPNCPTGAISFIEREAAAYDEAAVKAAQSAKKQAASGCPGSAPHGVKSGDASQLRNWPVQIRLAPVKAAYFDGADLLVAALTWGFGGLLPIAAPMPAAASTPISCKAALRSSAARSSTPSIMPRSSARSLPQTISSPSPSRACRCPAAADLSTHFSAPSPPPAKRSPSAFL